MQNRLHQSLSVHAYDFDEPTHPIARQVDPTGFSAGFDFLFNHLFSQHPEFGLGNLGGIFRLLADRLRLYCSFLGDHVSLVQSNPKFLLDLNLPRVQFGIGRVAVEAGGSLK